MVGALGNIVVIYFVLLDFVELIPYLSPWVVLRDHCLRFFYVVLVDYLLVCGSPWLALVLVGVLRVVLTVVVVRIIVVVIALRVLVQLLLLSLELCHVLVELVERVLGHVQG